MLSIRFKIIVVKMLLAILDIHIKKMIVSPFERNHPWKELREEASQFIIDAECELNDGLDVTCDEDKEETSTDSSESGGTSDGT